MAQTFFQKITYKDTYPSLKAEVVKNPNRLFAVPILGIILKLISLIPVLILMIFISIWWLIAATLINPFVVLITHKYWRPAYDVALGLIKMNVKIRFFMYGLTDKYPGFNLDIHDNYSLDLSYPAKSNKLFAIPFLGFVVRAILLVPYFFFVEVVGQAATIGVIVLAWAAVLFTGKYPEGIFELARDGERANASIIAYMSGLSDRYPSFYISMTNDKIKIILIVISLILSALRFYHNGSVDQLG